VYTAALIAEIIVSHVRGRYVAVGPYTSACVSGILGVSCSFLFFWATWYLCSTGATEAAKRYGLALLILAVALCAHASAVVFGSIGTLIAVFDATAILIVLVALTS
jgi:hypothetical protein